VAPVVIGANLKKSPAETAPKIARCKLFGPPRALAMMSGTQPRLGGGNDLH
jgi:hypothetical protein